MACQRAAGRQLAVWDLWRRAGPRACASASPSRRATAGPVRRRRTALFRRPVVGAAGTGISSLASGW